MRAKFQQDPPRWREEQADGHALAARAAALVSAAAEPVSLDPAALARIRADVRANVPPTPLVGWQILGGRARLAWVVGLLVLVGSAATASALWRPYLAHRLRLRQVGSPAGNGPTAPVARAPWPAPRVSVPAAALAPPPPAQPAVSAPAVVPGARAEGAGVLSGQRSAPREARVAREVARAERVTSIAGGGRMPATEPLPETEAHQLARALVDLRQRRDARAALSVLDEHDRAYPRGVLRAEAASARLEAVIELEDWATALALLDGTVAFSGPLGADLLLTRAELRAGANRCAEALADFSSLLDGKGGSLSAPASERALYGRAVCHGRLHDDARAREELTDYLRRFPRGRFAPDAARLLGGTTPREAP